MTTSIEAEVAHEHSEAQISAAVDKGTTPTRRPFGIGLGALVMIGTIAAWLLIRVIFAGVATFPLAPNDLTQIHQNLNTWPEWVAENQNSNPVFLYFINYIQIFLQHTGDFCTHLFAQTDVGLGIPEIGWLGTTVLVTYVAWVIGNTRVALLTLGVFLFFVLQGLWADTMITFALVVASVVIALIIGLPLGIWAGTSPRVRKFLTPVLDLLQIMPSLAYLAPLVLIFGIGLPSGIAATLIFAIAPVIRITAVGIQQVPLTTREAVDSIGVTRFQRLRTVLLPMAKRTTVIGINQTIMSAVSMVAIASFVGILGLGSDVQQALQSLAVGAGFNAGLAIVLLAIVFDRVTTAASVRSELAIRAGRTSRNRRRILLLAGLVITIVAIYLSRTFLWAAVAPDHWWDWGTGISSFVDTVSNWIQTHLSFLTIDIRDGITYGILNPLESLLTGSPFWAVVGAITVFAFVAGKWRPAIYVLISLLLIVVLGVWNAAMVTLASTILASVITMIVALLLGVWMGRSKVTDRAIRPILDAAQTMPSFVYLIPFLGLFGPSRITAIAAGVVFAAPAAIKIIADGVSQVSANTVEAALSNGSTPWQMITKVQLPMSMTSVGLAANQAVVYTLSMVVLGAAAGAGGLGYLVLNGLAKQLDYFGKGFAAGIALVLLGIVLDRITQATAARANRRSTV